MERRSRGLHARVFRICDKGRIEAMSDRIKVAVVISFVLLPVIGIALLKSSQPHRIENVSAISILPTRIVGNFQPTEDVAAVIREALSGIDGVRIADAGGADALVM